MAREDDPLPAQSGILDPLIGAGFFSSNMTLEEIKRRRAIGAALASRARAFPKTVGEGMTYFGEALGDYFQERRLAEGEKAYEEKFNKDAAPLRGRIGADETTAPPPPVVAPRADVVPPVARPAVAAVDPLTVEPTTGPASRGAIYQAIMARNGVVPPDPTVTAGSPPPTLPPGGGPLVSRNASLEDSGATFAEEGGPNPPTVSRDIRPMRVAQAGPLPAPVQPVATPGGTLAPIIPEALPDRAPPVKDERMTNTEKDAWTFWQKTRDPRAKDMFDQAHALGKAARDAKYNQEKTDYDKYVAQQIAREALREKARIEAPETTQKLQKGAAEVTAAQAAEQARIFHGNLPEPVRKVLDESKESAKLSVGVIDAIGNAREAQKYAVHGPGANWKLNYYRLKAETGDKEAQRIVQASQTYQSDLTPILQSLLKIAGKDISTKELEFLRSISGADLSLDKTSADRMLTIADKIARKKLADHTDTVETMIQGQGEKALPTLRKLYDAGAPIGSTPLVDTMAPADQPMVPVASDEEARAIHARTNAPVRFKLPNGRTGTVR